MPTDSESANSREETSSGVGLSVSSPEDSEIALLTLALNHSWAWFELHAGQRQNFINFFLVAVAFLSAAYVGALSGDLNALAASVCFIGVAVSVAFSLLDLRNRELTRAGEQPVRQLQATLADALGIDSLRILDSIDRPRPSWISHGKVIRTLHGLMVASFIVAGCYALLSG